MFADLQSRARGHREVARTPLGVGIVLSTIAFAVMAAMGVLIPEACASAQPAPGQVPAQISAGLLVQEAQRAAAAASAAAPSGVTPVGLPAPGAPASVAGPSGTSLPLLGKGIAPTIDALSAAQRAEIDADVRKRMTKALAGPDVPAVAGAASAPPGFPPGQPPLQVMKTLPAPVVARVINTTKTVVAIYGPVGEEVADIRLPNGSVVTAKAGADIAGFHVIHVSPQTVEFMTPRMAHAHKVGAASMRPAEEVLGATASHRPHPATRRGNPRAKASPVTILVAVGGTFR